MPRRAWGKITRKKDRYYAEYTGPDLARHTPGHSFPTRPDAELWLAQERRLIDLEAWAAPKIRGARAEAVRITVGEWIDRFNAIARDGGLRASTMQHYERVTRTRITEPKTSDRDVLALAHTPLTDLQTGDVYRWWDGLQREWPEQRQTNQKAYKRLRAAMAEAERRGMITGNPVKIEAAGKRVQTREKYLPSDEEIEAILAVMNPRYKLLTSLVLHHGLRIGEALGLEVGDVTIEPTPVPLMPRVTINVRRNLQRLRDLDGRTIMYAQAPKTRAGVRDVPMMGADVPYLLHHLAHHVGGPVTLDGEHGPRSYRLLTTTTSGRALMDTSYREILNRAEDAAGVTREIDPHCGRNWLITRLAEQGAHLKEIGTILGQEDVTVIMDVYMKVRAGRTTSLMDSVSKTLGR